MKFSDCHPIIFEIKKHYLYIYEIETCKRLYNNIISMSCTCCMCVYNVHLLHNILLGYIENMRYF